MLQPKTLKVEVKSTHTLVCPACGSQDYIKKGKSPSTKKQQYRCKECKKLFIENPEKVSASDYLPPGITPQQMFHYDLWDLRILGKKTTSSGQYSLNFSGIDIDWLKSATKKWLWYRASSQEVITLQRKLETIRHFLRTIKSYYSQLEPQAINRQVIQDFIADLHSKGNRPKTTAILISNLREFLEYCKRFDWLAIPKDTLVFDEDLPDEDKRLPKFIPDDVLKQIDDNLSSLPRPIACMIKVLRETGMRSSEVISLKFNCIRRDSTGDWWIDIYQRKMKKEISVYIPENLATEILEQQQYIKERIGIDFPDLFCQTQNHTWFRMYGTQKHHILFRELSYFEPIAQPIDTATLRGYLYWFAQTQKIVDITGDIFPIWRVHRFRHTHGTELINKGVPQHIVQKRLGHMSPEMTMHYAHIHDETMKREMEKFWDGKVVDIRGEVVISENPDLDTAAMQWIKKNMKAQALPNGFCGLPVTQSCPVQGSPCLVCSHFRTTKEHIETHKKQLENTEKIIKNASAKGWHRQVETNEPIAQNLRNIIQGLEGEVNNA